MNEAMQIEDGVKIPTHTQVATSIYHGKKPEMVNHPQHYGGADDPYEVIKIIEHFKLGFRLGNTVKYLLRAGKKGNIVEDLKKARWYLDREIAKLEQADAGE